VTGDATDATTVSVAATYVGPAPGQVSAPSAPPSAAPTPVAPAPAVVTPADDGSFTVNLDLTTGRWMLAIVAKNDQGMTTTLTRNVTVVYQGVNLVVQVTGGRAWLKVWVDGVVSATTGSGGIVVNDGQALTFSGTTSVEVRTGNSGVTSYTLNGISLGVLGKGGAPETWLFQPPAPPKRTDRTS
jgi:hypothetical protein